MFAFITHHKLAVTGSTLY